MAVDATGTAAATGGCEGVLALPVDARALLITAESADRDRSGITGRRGGAKSLKSASP